MSTSTLRFLRIGLYGILFVMFVLLFSLYGNVNIGGAEYFSPTNPTPIYVMLGILFGLVLCIGLILFFTRHTHSPALDELKRELKALRR